MTTVTSRLLAAFIFGLASVAAHAESIEIRDPWVREGPPNARVLGGFMQLVNAAADDDALRAGSCADFARVELHKTEVVDGVAKMLPQESIPLPANSIVDLEPGGYHIMLIDARRAFREGDVIEVELDFDSGKVQIEMPVRKGQGGMMDHSHHHH